MTVRRRDDTAIELSGHCELADAETLLAMLLASPQAIIDWRDCDFAHAAVVRIVLASRARLIGPPRSAFLRKMVDPAISRV